MINCSEMTEWRRYLHVNPETSFEEYNTAGFVAKRMRSWNIDVHTGIVGTGVVGVLKSGTSGRSVALRADMDALHITEENTFSYTSKIPGKMHACGHDGHTAMLLGAAKFLSENKHTINGKVYFVFQPGEEYGAGGEKMVQAGLFDKFNADSIFAIHNWPGLQEGHIAVMQGPMMASADEFYITVRGKSGHAAMPHLTIDPIVTLADIISNSQSIVSRRINPFDNAVLSFTRISGGATINGIPDEVKAAGTIRTLNNTTRNFIKQIFSENVMAIARTHGAVAEFAFDETTYPSTINNPRQAAFVATVASKMFGCDKIHTDLTPSMAAEDFGYMLNKKPGAYIWLGQGIDAVPLHNARYDFNDTTLKTGAELFIRIAQAKLG